MSIAYPIMVVYSNEQHQPYQCALIRGITYDFPGLHTRHPTLVLFILLLTNEPWYFLVNWCVCYRYIRAQKTREKLQTAVPKHLKKKNRDTWYILAHLTLSPPDNYHNMIFSFVFPFVNLFLCNHMESTWCFMW